MEARISRKKPKKSYKKLMYSLSLIVAVAIYLYCQNNWIKVEQYHVKINNLPKSFEGYKIVQVSDVHLPRNASTIDHLIDLVREQKPDLIMITGDVIDRSADLETCGLDKLCKGLVGIANVYAVTGNHEQGNLQLNEHALLFEENTAWKEKLASYQIPLIDDTSYIIEKNGEQIGLMGLLDYMGYHNDRIENIETIKDMPKILLAHHAELWSTYSSDKNEIRPDLVLSGHAHGGQFRIPFVGGFFSPDQGLFPKYTSGRYAADNGVQMIVSRGLGNSLIPFRINNRPALPVIVLEGK